MIDEESCKLNDRHVEVRVSSNKQRIQAVGLVDAMMVRWQGRIERLLALRGGRGEALRDKVQDTLNSQLCLLGAHPGVGARWRHFDVPRWSAHLDPITVGLAPFFSAIEVKVLRWKLEYRGHSPFRYPYLEQWIASSYPRTHSPTTYQHSIHTPQRER